MSEHVSAFRALHVNDEPLRLPNAWDAASARLFESLGAPAIATTSAGVAWALGYPDGRALPVDAAIDAAARMARVLTAPLSIDIENGYSDDPQQVALHVQRLIDIGVSGINIEDGRDSPDLLAAKIEAIRTTAAKSNRDIFINARCDVFLAQLVDKRALVEESIARGTRYASAGADGFFVPGLVKGGDIVSVIAGVPLPLNLMVWPGLAPSAELGALGVRRLSAGPAISRIIWERAAKMAGDFLDTGRSEPMFDQAMPHAQLQGLFADI
jgi:2-methylisocitrate lyase-like PEP mutase family enzyme